MIIMIPPDILESNRDLTPGERHNIKKLAQDTDAKLKEVKKALTKVKRGKEKLKKEKNNLLKTANNCQLALAPIRMLPRDVIGEIFLTCIRGEKPSMSYKKAPVLLTHICSGFRHTALSTPTLWATITLYVPEVRVRSGDEGGNEGKNEDEDRIAQIKSYLWSRVDAIGKWIHRSGTVPLSIGWMSRMESGMLERFKEEQCALAEVLLRSTSRLRHLSLQGSQPCIQIIEPLLIALHNANQLFLPGNIFQAPNLTELSLEGSLHATTGYLDVLKFYVNWSQFTRLTLSLCLSYSTPEILRQTKNLIQLSLDGLKIEDDTNDIYLPYLQELTVSTAGLLVQSGIHSVATYIHAPALETLRVDACEILLSNLVKRAPRLRNLIMHIINSDTVNAWLRICPQITSLGIIFKSYSWNYTVHVIGLLEELVLDHGGTYTCPNLRIFYYDGVLMVPSDILCRFLGAEHGRSDTPLLRTWENLRLKVFITDWESKSENRKALKEVVAKWKRAGVLQLEIMNPEP